MPGPTPEPYASSRSTSSSERGSVTAKEIHERSHSRRRTTMVRASGEEGAATERKTSTGTSQKGWEDIEAAEENQRSKIRWGGVLVVIILVLGLIAAGLYDYHKRRQAEQAEEAARAAQRGVSAPATP